MSHNQPFKAANQLRRYRKKRCLRLMDIAKLAGLSGAAHISHWEKGRKLPSLANALKLAAAIQCPVEVLFLDLFNHLRKDIYENKKKYDISNTYK